MSWRNRGGLKSGKKRGGYADRVKQSMAERSRRKEAEEQRWRREKEEIRRAEEKRAQKISDDNHRAKIRKRERGRAERKAGVRPVLDFSSNLEKSKTKSKKPKSSGAKKSVSTSIPRQDPFFGSGADDIIFSGGGSKKGKSGKKRKDPFEDFKAFEDML